MELIRFWTRYGYKVVGGRFGDLVRSPSTTEELNAPIEIVSDDLVAKAESDHAAALDKLR
jgi:hypothetical protein